MLVISRFDVPESGADEFLVRADAALAAFADRRGFLRGRIGRSPDEPTGWVLTTEWDGIGSYRRSLSSYDVKVHAITLLAEGRDEVGAFEVLAFRDGPSAGTAVTDRAAGAATSYPAKKDG